MAESKAKCPHCERQIHFDEIEQKWDNQNSYVMKIKCKCKRTIGITTDMRGNFIKFEY